MSLTLLLLLLMVRASSSDVWSERHIKWTRNDTAQMYKLQLCTSLNESATLCGEHRWSYHSSSFHSYLIDNKSGLNGKYMI